MKVNIGAPKIKTMRLGSDDYVNVICLHCRKSANSLPCTHPKIRTKIARVPRKDASDKQWRKFLRYLNRTHQTAYVLP